MKQTRAPRSLVPCLWQASPVSYGQNLHQALQGAFPSCPQNLIFLFFSRPLICLKKYILFQCQKMFLENICCSLPLKFFWGELPWLYQPSLSLRTRVQTFSQLPPFRKRWSKIKQPPLCQSYLLCGLVPWPLASCSYCCDTTVVVVAKAVAGSWLLRGWMGCSIWACLI